VVGIFRESERERPRAILVGPEGTFMVEPEALLVATGQHDPTPVFRNNDLPGIQSARAGLGLLGHGIAVAERVLLAGTGRFADAFAQAGGRALSIVRSTLEELTAATGRSRVRGAVLGEDKRVRVAAILVDGPGAPAHEFALQAGASVDFDAARGYVVRLDPDGRAAADVFVAGSAAGGALGSDLDGERVGAAIGRALA
jgi:hypothetical protein